MKLTSSQIKYLLLLSSGNLLRVDEAQKSVKMRGYNFKIQYNTFQKFRDERLIISDNRFYNAKQPQIKYFTLSELGKQVLEKQLVKQS